jgi:HAE1 family hydrophobic/amphiphilic exporter-1
MMDDNPEIAVNINRERAARLGVPIASIAASVRTSMYGKAVTRFRGGEDDIDVFLRLDADQRDSVTDLKSLTVPAMTGGQVRLSNIADISEDNSPIEIRHLDQQRMLRVMADVSGRALGDVSGDIEEAIETERQTGGISPDVSTQFGGDVKEQRNMIVDLSIALLLSVLLIYMVMAAQFESLMDPLIVMFSVPFGITGVLLALPATGITLSITSFIGMIMLVGIVTKNAIVLVDYINQLREKGMPLHEAIVTGGSRRLRPVLMTALTTIGGMLPLAISSGEGSEMWKPMAVAVIGGLALSTIVTLILIPSVYALTDRWRKRGREVTA